MPILTRVTTNTRKAVL